MRSRLLGIFTQTDKRILLGRWNREENVAIKSVLANFDNCGDEICGDPKKLSEFIKKEITKEKGKIIGNH